MPAAQGILTYIANRTLPYHLYADESGLLVLVALLTSASLSKNKFFDRLQKAHPSGWAFLSVSAFRPGDSKISNAICVCSGPFIHS